MGTSKPVKELLECDACEAIDWLMEHPDYIIVPASVVALLGQLVEEYNPHNVGDYWTEIVKEMIRGL